MAIQTWTDSEGNTYSAPYIPQKTWGVHGINPSLVGLPSGSPSGGSGGLVDDHEQLQHLLGGDNSGHWHISEFEHMILERICNALHPYSTNLDPLGALIEQKITAKLGG